MIAIGQHGDWTAAAEPRQKVRRLGLHPDVRAMLPVHRHQALNQWRLRVDPETWQRTVEDVAPAAQR